MPLIIADQGPLALRAAPNRFLVFYSSPVNGELWCPDCRAVEHLVKDTFTGEETPDALIVHVGDRSQWKVESNPYRKNPWHLTNIPTIIKLDNGKEVKRLVDREITAQNLKLLVKEG